MAYTPTEWVTGDVITAEKLNKAEQGIKDANSVVTVTLTWESDNEWYLGDTKTADAKTAFVAGVPVLFVFSGGSYDGVTASAISINGYDNFLCQIQQDTIQFDTDGDGYIYKYLGD